MAYDGKRFIELSKGELKTRLVGFCQTNPQYLELTDSSGISTMTNNLSALARLPDGQCFGDLKGEFSGHLISLKNGVLEIDRANFEVIALHDHSARFFLRNSLPFDWQDVADFPTWKDLRTFLLGMGLPAIRFHDLRASWATILLSRGIEPVKVMKMGGWKDLDTMMIYVRKAGIDVSGSLGGLNLHNHRPKLGDVLQLKKSPGSDL